jgi:D-sedoheptulose 7-phosphate isomerase
MTLNAFLDDVVAAARRADLREVEKAIALFQSCYNEGRAVFVIGNGGSAANASHFAQDLAKGCMPDMEGRRFRVLSLADNVAYLTALSNDIGYDRVFDLQLRQFAAGGDVLVAISGSGNSGNILKAVDYAKAKGLRIVSVTGFDGGQLMPMADIRLHVPVDDMFKTESVHAILLHMICDELRRRLKP